MRHTESLEQRRLLASDVSLTSRGTLLVHGDEADNRVEVRFDFGGSGIGDDVIRATVYSRSGADNSDEGDVLASDEFSRIDVQRIAIYLFEGNDVAILDDDGFDEFQRHVTIAGGEGDDRIGGDTNGPLLLEGGAGNDRVGIPAVFDYGGLRKNRDVLNRYLDDKASEAEARGGEGDTSSVSILGGPGDDVLYAGYNAVVVDGGDGNDIGFVGVAIDRDMAVPASRLVGLSNDFYARLASANVEAFDAAIVGTSVDNGFLDDLFGGDEADLDDDLFGSRA